MTTEPKPKLGDLPHWPRLLSVEQAAAYVGVSVNAFRARIGKMWPAAVSVGKRRLYDRAALDEAIDGLTGMDKSAASEPDEEDPTDAMRRVRGYHG